MLATLPCRSLTDSDDLISFDEENPFAADERGVRWGLVDRVRQSLAEGTYDESAALDQALDRLLLDLR